MRGNLFSNYFLEEGIKNTEDWKRCTEKEIREIYSKIRSVYVQFSKRKKPDEADTEDGLIEPILKYFGFYWSRQKSPSQKGRQDIPDYILFPDENSKNEFDKEDPSYKPWYKAICILEGKRWRRSLDKRDKTDPVDPHVPSNQILRYLSVIEPVSNGRVVWGILTNGEIWRLYYQRVSSRAEGYIEFNLNEIFEEEHPDLFDKSFVSKKEKFKIFYLLFRKMAFVPTTWRPYKTFLEIALEEGKRWEEKVAESLKEKIFSEIFPDIAKGFLNDIMNKREKIDELLLQKVYNNTLVLLYRLLFIFYAEDRDLLPVRNEKYRSYSLSKIRDEIAEKIDRKEILSETACVYWERIKNLFKIINNGDKSLGIPPYNGGLFDPNKYPFLENYSISDKFLVPAIDKLSREYTGKFPRRINYRDLSVRQLGSIYEGLLEFKLKIAKKPLGVKKEKNREVYYEVNNEAEAKIKKGELYLTNDRSERKATGSYYTPDYVVQYIVKHTIEPLIQEKLAEFKNWKKELENKNANELRSLLKKIENLPSIGFKKEGINEMNIHTCRNVLLKLRDPAESLLELKILDPAMGSGHFLVGAVDYLSDRILEILAETSGKNYFGEETYISPLLEKLEDLRKRILKKAQDENYIIDEAKLEDKNLIKRIVLKRCIYGVDSNPLAVELAKVSLWLHTFTVGAPLSFLDHHLKCGNSLIGADLEDFNKILKRSPLYGLKYTGLTSAITMIKKLQEITDADISEVEESAKIYAEVTKQLQPYKTFLDIYTADLCLRPRKKSELRKYYSPLNLLDGTKGDPIKVILKKTNLLKAEEEMLQNILNFAKEKKFFHWKLEFPEVWYRQGEYNPLRGFDIVISNPPYGAEFDKTEKSFLERTFTTHTKDSAAYFIERGLQLTRSYFGMILPKSISFYHEWESIRNYIFEKGTITRIGDVGMACEDAIFEQLILIITKSKAKNPSIIEVFTPLKKPLSIKTINISVPLNYKLMDKEKVIIFMPLSNEIQKTVEKIFENSLPIGKVADRIFGNINLTDIKRKLDKSESEILEGPFFDFPVIKSEHKDYVPFIRRDPDLGRYLVKRWYLLKIPKNYKKLKKLLVPRMFIKPLRGNRLVGYWDEKGSFATHHHMISCTLKIGVKFSYPFLTAIINSKVPSFCLQTVLFSGTTETAREMNTPYFSKIPIPKINFSKYDKAELESLKEKYENNKFTELREKINSLPSGIAVLHDFLDYLAREMVKLSKNKYFLELFIEKKLKEGSNEIIEVIKLLQNHLKWEDKASEELKKQIAINLRDKYQDRINLTDNLIDHVVYRLYGLSDREIEVVEDFFKQKP